MKIKKPYCKDIYFSTSSAVRLSLYFPAFAGKYFEDPITLRPMIAHGLPLSLCFITSNFKSGWLRQPQVLTCAMAQTEVCGYCRFEFTGASYNILIFLSIPLLGDIEKTHCYKIETQIIHAPHVRYSTVSSAFYKRNCRVFTYRYAFTDSNWAKQRTG